MRIVREDVTFDQLVELLKREAKVTRKRKNKKNGVGIRSFDLSDWVGFMAVDVRGNSIPAHTVQAVGVLVARMVTILPNTRLIHYKDEPSAVLCKNRDTYMSGLRRVNNMTWVWRAALVKATKDLHTDWPPSSIKPGAEIDGKVITRLEETYSEEDFTNS